MLWLIALMVLAFYFAVFYKSQSFTDTTYESGKTPSIFAILLKILVRVLRRRQGQIYNAGGKQGLNDGDNNGRTDDTSADTLHVAPGEDEIVVIKNYRVTPELVAQYKAVCGENCDDEKVPLCFPECLFMYNMLLLTCKPSFKLSPLGLIHIGQTVKQHGDLQQLLDSPCCVEARTSDYRIMSKGIEVDVDVRVTMMSGQCVWSGVATLLSRSKNAQSSGSMASSSRHQVDDSDWDSQDGITRKQIDVAADTGVKYAKVSGDWNPHHLYSWSARLLGYRAPIAHGLWTLGKAAALITDAAEDPSRFTEVETRFKRPLFLPGTATLEYYAEDGKIKFRITDSKTRAPHLIGTLF